MPGTLHIDRAGSDTGDPAVAPAVPPGGGPPSHDLAVVIVSMNDTAWLPPCLTTLYAHAGDIRMDVVVVENGDPGPTAALIEAEFPAVRLIDRPNLGFAAGNNAGLAGCDARFALFLNPDTEIAEGTMAGLITALELRPDVGLAGVRHLTAGRRYPSMRRFPNAARALGQALAIERAPWRPAALSERVLEMDRYERETACDWTVGAFMIVRREALEAAGPFDSRFFLYSEEVDLCRRVTDAGWSVRHLPQLTIVHHAGKGGTDPRLEAQSSYARLQYAAKHFNPIHRALYRLILLGGAFARWIVATGRSDRERRLVATRVLRVLAGRDGPPFGRHRDTGAGRDA